MCSYRKCHGEAFPPPTCRSAAQRPKPQRDTASDVDSAAARAEFARGPHRRHGVRLRPAGPARVPKRASLAHVAQAPRCAVAIRVGSVVAQTGSGDENAPAAPLLAGCLVTVIAPSRRGRFSAASRGTDGLVCLKSSSRHIWL